MKSESPETSLRLQPWLDDGNVVLSAEGKYFRVHRSVLSFYSRIFKDIFSCPQPSVSQDRDSEPGHRFIDGCPVVHLSDAVGDLEIILKAMYDGSSVVAGKGPMPISVVIAFLRLGKKYEIPKLYNKAHEKLSECYPSSLASFTSLRDSLGLVVSGIDPHHFLVVEIAHEIGLPSILSVALYLCLLSCPIDAIIGGYELDGATYSLSPSTLKAYAIGNKPLTLLRHKSFEWLTPSELQKMQRKKELFCPEFGSYSCSDDLRCRSGAHTILSHVVFCTPPLDPTVDWSSKWNGCFCSHCQRLSKKKYEAMRNQFWAALPSTLGIGQSWEELEQKETRLDSN